MLCQMLFGEGECRTGWCGRENLLRPILFTISVNVYMNTFDGDIVDGLSGGVMIGPNNFSPAFFKIVFQLHNKPRDPASFVAVSNT